MSELSLSAQEVMDAVHGIIPHTTIEDSLAIAAALRAAADQVMPEEPLYGGDQRWMFERDARQESRKKFLAIAAELEGSNDHSD